MTNGWSDRRNDSQLARQMDRNMDKQMDRPHDRDKWDDTNKTDISKDGPTAVSMDRPTGRTIADRLRDQQT